MVILFEGVNDLGISYGRFEGEMAEVVKSLPSGDKATAEAMIAGYRQLIARARARGLKVLAATILPDGGAMYYSEEGEAVRQAINTWIRTGGEVDGVLDFDAVVRDPAKPNQIKDGFHSGDYLHGSDAGYAAMAASVDLSLLQVSSCVVDDPAPARDSRRSTSKSSAGTCAIARRGAAAYAQA